MPSSVIVGALVLAWLVVLVPMVARRRQEVARTEDSALAARVVRSGTMHRGTEEARAMSDAATDDELRDGRERPVPAERTGKRVTSKYYDDYDYYETDGYPELDDAYLGGAPSDHESPDELDDRRHGEDTEHPGTGYHDRGYDDEHPEYADPDDDDRDHRDRSHQERDADGDADDRDANDRDYDDQDYDDQDYDEDDEYTDEYTDELPLPDEREPGENYREPEPNRRRPRARAFRPGRGGYNPEAAELSKQAKYAFRRRVVLAMVITVVGSALAAAIAFPLLWWGTLVVTLSLTGYLVYLRRQVRLEEEIRQRRLSRMRATGWTVPESERADEPVDAEIAERRQVEADTAHDMLPDFHTETPPQHRVSAPPPPAVPGTAVVDVDDEDPAFDDLAEPGSLPYRRAAGE